METTDGQLPRKSLVWLGAITCQIECRYIAARGLDSGSTARAVSDRASGGRARRGERAQSEGEGERVCAAL